MPLCYRRPLRDPFLGPRNALPTSGAVVLEQPEGEEEEAPPVHHVHCAQNELTGSGARQTGRAPGAGGGSAHRVVGRRLRFRAEPGPTWSTAPTEWPVGSRPNPGTLGTSLR